MATTIKLKNGSGAPLAGDLVQGEPALDLTNKRLYTEDSGGTVIEVGTNPTSLTTGTFTSTGIDDNATSTAITIDASENVGIGTASPNALLDVADGNIRLTNTSGSGSYHDFAYGGTNGENFFINADRGSTGSGNMIFRVGGASEKMRIDSSGNVGIGTSSPSAFGTLAVKSTGTQLALTATTGSATMLFDENGTDRFFIKSLNGSDGLAFVDADGSTERMRIDASGNVGIGTDSPGYPLDVVGSMRIRHAGSDDFATIRGPGNRSLRIDIDPNSDLDSFVVRDLRDGSERFTVQAGGNVGIGTTSPGSSTNYNTLTINGTTGGIVEFHSGGSLQSYILGNSSELRMQSQSTQALTFYTNGTERMRIETGGKIGIGTSNPDETLHVHKGSAGTASSQANSVLTLENSTGAILQFLTPNTADQQIRFGDPQDNGAGYINYSHSVSAMTFAVNGPERMRIDSAGVLMLGRSTTTVNQSNFGFVVFSSGLLNTSRDVTGTSTVSQFYGNAGQFRTMGDGDAQNTNNSYGAISDERLKSNIVDASSQIDDIMAVQVRSYTLNETGDTHIGVVAQELEASGMSGLVKTDDEGMKAVKYSVLYMKAIKALQEAVTRIETLEAEVAALKGA